MPTRKELRSIVDYGRQNPSINPAYFPNTMASFYWSSTTSYASQHFWGMYFENCEDNSLYWPNSRYVRAVRGGQNRLLGHLIVLSPSQAGKYEGGSLLPITWDTAGIEGDVRISLSRDGGTTFRTIAAQTSNDGSYDWTITGPASANCMLKIEPLSDASRGAVQGLFTIHYEPKLADAVKSLQVVSGMDVSDAIDVTRDGIVDVRDAIYSLQFEAGLR